MALSEDQLIIAKAIDLITSVSPAVVARCRREGNLSNPTVRAPDLIRLVDAIEASYPGAIERSREGGG